jgi:hypothetical protein
LVVTLPASQAPTRLTFALGHRRTHVALLPGERRTVLIPIDVRGPATVEFSADRFRSDGRRFTSVRSSRPVFERFKTAPVAADIP